MPGGKGWARPGEAANIFRWNLNRGGRYTEPGKAAPRGGEQLNLPRMPSDWSPSAAPRYRIETSRPGKVPPADAWNFTPETGKFTPPGQEVPPSDASMYTQISPLLEDAPPPGAVALPNAPTPDPSQIIRRELASHHVGVGSDAVPTTVSLSGGRTSTGNTSSLRSQILQVAASYGLPTRVVDAILVTEGGLAGDVGDYGKSFGPFQFYGGGGQLNNFAAQYGFGSDWRSAGQYILKNPLEAADWALRPGGYLGDSIRMGMSQGLTGSDLATYAQRYGQVSVSPERAGRVYLTLGGGDLPTGGGLQALGGPKVQARPVFEDETPGVGEQLTEPKGQPWGDPNYRTPAGPVPSQPTRDYGPWGEDLSDTVWSELGARHLASQGGMDVERARELYQDPLLSEYKRSTLDMARKGELSKYLPEGMRPGAGQDRRRGWGKGVGAGQEGFMDYAGRELGEAWGQISQPQQWYDPALGAMRALGLPFEPLSAGTRYGVGALVNLAEGRGISPEEALATYEERTPMPLKLLTELAAPAPPIGKIAKLSKWGKALGAPKPKSGWLGAVAEGAEEASDDIVVATDMSRAARQRAGRTLSAAEDPGRLEQEAELWEGAARTGVPGEAEELSRQALGMSFPEADVAEVMHGGKAFRPISEATEQTARGVEKFDPKSIVPEYRGYERGGYANPSVGEKGKMGAYGSPEAMEAKANRMLGTASREEFVEEAPRYAQVLSKRVLQTGYLAPEGKVILFPRQLKEMVGKQGYEEKLDRMMDALVPSRDAGEQRELYEGLLMYTEQKSPILLDLRHGSLEPVEFYRMQKAVPDPKKPDTYMLPEVKTQNGNVMMPKVGGLDGPHTRFFHNWRGGRKNPSDMTTIIEGGIGDADDLAIVNADLKAQRAEQWDFAMERLAPKAEAHIAAPQVIRTLHPEDVGKMGAGVEKELWKYGIKKERAADVLKAAGEGRSARILRTPQGMDVDFPPPAAVPQIITHEGKSFKPILGVDEYQGQLEEFQSRFPSLARKMEPPAPVLEGTRRTDVGPWRPAVPGEGDEYRLKFEPATEERVRKAAADATESRGKASPPGQSWKESEYGDPFYGPKVPRIPDYLRIPYEKAVAAEDWDEVARLQPQVDEFILIDQPRHSGYRREDWSPLETAQPGKYIGSVKPVNPQRPRKPALTEGQNAGKLPSATQREGTKMATPEMERLQTQINGLGKQWLNAKTDVQRKAIDEGMAKLKKRLAELQGLMPGEKPEPFSALWNVEELDRFTRRLASRTGRLREEVQDEQEEERVEE